MKTGLKRATQTREEKHKKPDFTWKKGLYMGNQSEGGKQVCQRVSRGRNQGKQAE